MCADTQQGMKLQNIIGGDWTEGAQTYNFVVDTCANLAQYTGATSCVTGPDLANAINEIYVSTKISEEFFSAKTYASNDQKLNSEFK